MESVESEFQHIDDEVETAFLAGFNLHYLELPTVYMRPKKGCMNRGIKVAVSKLDPQAVELLKSPEGLELFFAMNEIELPFDSDLTYDGSSASFIEYKISQLKWVKEVIC